MSLNPKLEKRVRAAVKHFWSTRKRQLQKQDTFRDLKMRARAQPSPAALK